jgi:rod shape-determining protein MreC
VGWVGDTLHAKSQLATVRSERDRLRQEVIAAQGALTENTHLRNLVGLDQQLGLSSYGLVSARVIARAPTLWYATINVDRGSADGVRVDQPVITGEGLVGKVTAVSASAAQVTLITDHSSNVSAKVNETNDPGIIKADVGNPNDLVLDFLPSHSKVRRGDRVVTSGTLSSPGVSPDLRSLFPTGVPIGVVTSVDRSGVSVYPEVHVRPYVDLRRLDVVQILTRNVPGNQQASAP